MAQFLVQVDFHHNVESVAVLVAADDKDAAEGIVFARFAEHPDWAVEFVSVVREAQPEDAKTFLDVVDFS